MILFQKGEYGCQKSELREKWKELGGWESDPEPSTLDDPFYLLRKRLKPLGVTVRSQDKCWLLTVLDSGRRRT
jgi:hypothetical protein